MLEYFKKINVGILQSIFCISKKIWKVQLILESIENFNLARGMNRDGWKSPWVVFLGRCFWFRSIFCYLFHPTVRNDWISTNAKFSEILTFLSLCYVHIRVRIRGERNASFLEIFAYILNEWFPTKFTPVLPFSSILHFKVEGNIEEFLASIFLLEVNNGNNRGMCETCSKLMTPEWHHWRRSVVFIESNIRNGNNISKFGIYNKKDKGTWCCSSVFKSSFGQHSKIVVSLLLIHWR